MPTYTIFTPPDKLPVLAKMFEEKDGRDFTGGKDTYDLRSAQQFDYLLQLGLRENHKVLDIGCGDLALGRLLIPFLKPNCYFGIEPEGWLIKYGFKHELGFDIAAIKRPKFRTNSDFGLSVFGEKFDFIMAYSVFSHATKKQIDTCLHEARHVLKDTGKFLFTYVPSYLNDNIEDRNIDCDVGGWTYPGVNSYTPNTMRDLALSHGFNYGEFKGFSPNNQKWCIVDAKRDKV